MSYEHDMSEEKEPRIKKLIPEGWLKGKVTAMEEAKSKAGNDMIITTLTFPEENYSEDIYLIVEKGKRWMLKKLLKACGCQAANDGVYKWDFSDVLDKDILIYNQHEDNKYINRDGIEVENKQNRFNDFQEIEWDHDQ